MICWRFKKRPRRRHDLFGLLARPRDSGPAWVVLRALGGHAGRRLGQALPDGDAAAPAGREAGCRPIMSFLLDALRTHVGYDAFRAGQEALVRAVIDGRNRLAVMPTGWGKSLGYQLPAVVLHPVDLRRPDLSDHN